MALLEINKLTKSFGGLVAVNEVNFEVYEGEILGLIGPNGSGKTTIFNLITGFLVPDRGDVKLKGERIEGLTPHEISKRGLGRTFQTGKSFPHMTVLENVMVGGFIDSRSVREVRSGAIEILQFTGLLEQQDKMAENLTIGDLRRLEIAKALATRPHLLLLDEVLAGLNPTEVDEAIEIIRKIREKGVTIFIVEHVMHAIMTLSDRVLVLNYGRNIAEGEPKDVVKNEKVIEAYLGEEYIIE